jgi:hypothetical protein
MSTKNEKNPTGELVILAIVLTLIYIFLKYLGEIVGYVFILGGLVYFFYSLLKRRKTGLLFDLFERKYVAYSKKLLGIYSVGLIVGGFIFAGIGSWLNPSYTYCECEKIAEGEILVDQGIEEGDPFYPSAKRDSWGMEACANKIISDLDLEMSSEKMDVYYVYEVAGKMCSEGFYEKNDGKKVYAGSQGKISILKSLQTLYKNVHYNYLGGLEAEIEEAKKEDERLFGKPNNAVPKQEEVKPTPTPSPEPDSADATPASPSLFVVNDPDGFSNLRQSPGGAIMRKVYKGEKFEVIGEESNHSQVKLADGTIGFIHKSRIIPAP